MSQGFFKTWTTTCSGALSVRKISFFNLWSSSVSWTGFISLIFNSAKISQLLAKTWKFHRTFSSLTLFKMVPRLIHSISPRLSGLYSLDKRRNKNQIFLRSLNISISPSFPLLRCQTGHWDNYLMLLWREKKE